MQDKELKALGVPQESIDKAKALGIDLRGLLSKLIPLLLEELLKWVGTAQSTQKKP